MQVVDSHTEGQPTRVVISGGPDLGVGSLPDRLHRFRTRFDHIRSGIVQEPRGSEVIVGALLLPPIDTSSSAAAIFFNDVGYLGMCGHGTIGLVTTLAYLGRIQAGTHRIETPVGTVSAVLSDDGSVTITNVPSFRYKAAVHVDVPGIGRLSGDIAWAGNWFFLTGSHPFKNNLIPEKRTELLAAATAVRTALQAAGITGKDGAMIDHVDFFSPPHARVNSSRSFTLCPGASFDRSPCGTGTSAKMACLYADGKLAPGKKWRQEGILGTVFEGSIELVGGSDGTVIPSIRGRAWITAESTLIFAADDPLAGGITFA